MYYISIQPFYTRYKHYYKIISKGNGKLVAYTPCSKCHVHSKLTGSRRNMWEYAFSSMSMICQSLLLAIFRRGWAVRAKELKILVGSDFFQTWKLSSWKPYLCPIIHSYSDKLVLRRIQYFIAKIWSISCAKNFNLTILL